MSRRALVPAVLAFTLLLAGCAGGAEPKQTAAAADVCHAPPEPGQSKQTFEYLGRARSYEQYVPTSVAGGAPLPVVFDFHGYGSSAAQQMLYGDFRKLADADRFFVVAPDGQGAPRHFNLTSEPGLQDDVAMVTSLLDHLERGLCVDPKRVFSAGMSNGGAMTSALACRAPDRFAAFGAVTVVVHVAGCAGATPVSIVAFAGTADPIVPFAGGQVNCCGNPTLAGAGDAMRGWAEHDGCSSGPTEQRLSPEVRQQTWTGCASGTNVVFYIVDGGGHTWPGAVQVPGLGLTTRQIDASRTIWDFFKRHPLSG